MARTTGRGRPAGPADTEQSGPADTERSEPAGPAPAPAGRPGRPTALVDRWWTALGPPAAAFVVATGAAVAAGPTTRYADERDYLQLVDHLLRLGRYTADGTAPSAYRPPGYPLALAAIGRVAPSTVAYRLVGAALLAVTVYLTYRLVARHAGGHRTGLLAASLVAVNPLVVYTAATLYPQTQAAALLLAVLVLTAGAAGTAGTAGGTAAGTAAASAGSPGNVRLRAGAAGVAAGALTLTVPTLAVAAVVAAGWLVRRTRRAGPALVLLIAAAATVLPWTVRNQVALGAFVPISTNSGFNLLLGNSERTGPDSGTLVDLGPYVAEVERRGYGEVEQNAYYQRQAVAWMTGNPVAAASLYGRKVAHQFAVNEQMGTEGAPGGRTRALLLAVGTLPVLALAAARAAGLAGGRLHPVEALCALVYLAATAATAVFFTRLRFRVPLEPLGCVLAAHAVTAGWARWTPRARRPGRPGRDRAAAIDLTDADAGAGVAATPPAGTP